MKRRLFASTLGLVVLLSGALPLEVLAATSDITGLIPTLTVTFDAGSVVNDNGTGSLTVTGEGTSSFPASPNGKAINTALYTPYGNLSNVTLGGSPFSISAYATLGANANGILFCLKDSSGSMILRRGATTDSVVMTLNNSTAPIITVSGVPLASGAYHHYALVATTSGITLYVDGLAKGTSTSNAVANIKANYQFGSRHGGILAGEAKLGGSIDDFRIYNAELTQAQVQSLADSFPGAMAGTGMIGIKTGTRGDLQADGNVSLFNATTTGPVPLESWLWNKTPNGTGGAARSVTNLINSAGVLTGAKLYYTIPNNWYSAAATNIASGTLTKAYFDDGTAATYTINESGTSVVLPNPGVSPRGWEAMLTGVPYEHADLYLLIASDQAQASFKACPIYLKVGDGAWIPYYGMPGLERTLSGTLNWPGAVYSTGTFKEGNHYLKVALNNLTTNTAIAIAHGPRNTGAATRIGLAGIQLVRRDSASDTSDPFYLRTVTGTTNWSDSVWQNAGGTTNWADSTEARKTIAVLTTSGTTSMPLPAEGVTAEAVAVRGSGPFTLSGPGTLTLNGASILDSCGMTATDIVEVSSSVLGTNITLAANNPDAAGTGYTTLSAAGSDFTSLSVTRGTLLANTPLPAAATVVLNGGSLVFTDSATFANTLDIAGAARVRVRPTFTAELTQALTGTNSITKSDNGTLKLSGGGAFGYLGFADSGLVRFTGSAPFAIAGTAGSGAATTLEVDASVNMSTLLSLGGATLSLTDNGVITTPSLRWCDTGAYNTTANQTTGRLVVTGAVNTVNTSPSVLFAHWSGTFNYALSGGEFLASNAVAMLTWDGSGTWTLSGSGHAYVKGINMKGHNKAGTSVRLALNGGLLEIGSNGIFSSGTDGNRMIDLGAGTLRALADFTVAAAAVSNAVTLTSASTGATLDMNGKTVTWNAPLAGSGKLVISDSAETKGRVKLAGVATHAGGTELLSGTLETGAAGALGAGPLALSGGTLDLGAVDATAGSMTVTNTVTLKVRLGMEADLSGSGSLSPASVTFLNDATNTLQVVLDLNGIDTPLLRYPLLLSPSLPADATNRMSITFINGGAGLLPTAGVSLETRPDGIYALFSGVNPPKNLFWRNGVSAGTWSTADSDTPWGIDSASGTSTYFANVDTVNFMDTDQASVTVGVPSPLAPILMNLNHSGTDYSFAETGSGLITLPALTFTKRGSGSTAFNIPVALTNTLSVEAGELALNAPFGTVASATFTAPLAVETNAAALFGYSGTQTLAGGLLGTGTVSVTAGRLRISSAVPNFYGEVAAAGGVLEVSTPSAFLNSPARIRIDAGATCEFTALDASGYSVPNTNPIELAGTLKVLQRDSTARGIRLYDGAQVLLKGSGMDSGHALDLFNQPIIALVSGTAAIKPLDTNDAAQASIIVRTENSPKTFDVQTSNAVLTVDTPLIGGNSGIVVDKTGPGTLIWTAVHTTLAKLRVSAGTWEIAGAGSLGSGASAQPIEIVAGATFLLSSSANQTLSGAITCSGQFIKTGQGKLILSGTTAVASGGALVVPAADTASGAVQVDNLTLDGELRVSNAGALLRGKTYTLLTSSNPLPADVATKVTGLGEHWTVETVNGGKTLLAYLKVGATVLIK